MSSYLSIDESTRFVALSKSFSNFYDESEILGVAGSDVQLDAIETVLEPLAEVTNIQDLFLVNAVDQIVLYS